MTTALVFKVDTIPFVKTGQNNLLPCQDAIKVAQTVKNSKELTKTLMIALGLLFILAEVSRC
jgi:hypothetical protein